MDPYDYEQLEQENALFPWLADNSMADPCESEACTIEDEYSEPEILEDDGCW